MRQSGMKPRSRARTPRRTIAVAGLAVAAAFLTGCGDAATQSGDAPTEPTPPHASQAPASPTPTTTTPSTSSDKDTSPVSLKGVITRELTNPGCLQIRTVKGDSFVVGGLSKHTRSQVPAPLTRPDKDESNSGSGLRVRLQGHFAPMKGQASVCGSGRTFVVTQADVLGVAR